MNCTEAEIYVSALNDGEPVPSNAAQHIASCKSCRNTLQEYSRMGAELRLAATVSGEYLPLLQLPPRTHWFDFLWRRVSVPRFALMALLACLVLSTGAISIIRAQQSRPLWFQFGYGFTEGQEIFRYTIAKQGYDGTQWSMASLNGSPEGATLRIKVESISADDVVLRCRASSPGLQPNGNGFTFRPDPRGKPSLEGVAPIHYKPGESLAIPIEGGGTLYLRGEVMDHQPKIAFGAPLEPPADKMIIRSPVLTGPEGILANINGGSASANIAGEGIRIRAGDDAYFFGAHAFPGAVQGELNWGQITFKLDGKEYRLVAAAPILSGDQPRPVWVRHAAESDWATGCGVCIGAGPLPK